jgi:hypothetical protein
MARSDNKSDQSESEAHKRGRLWDGDRIGSRDNRSPIGKGGTKRDLTDVVEGLSSAEVQRSNLRAKQQIAHRNDAVE